MARPTVAIPGRFSASASALRFEALVEARQLVAAVFRAGGEPLIVLPEANANVASRLRWADAVLLPGGGDLDPSFYGESPSTGTIYHVDVLQDEFDLAVARWAITEGVPLFGICRGLQVMNVALGGTLHQDIGSSHRARTQKVTTEAGSWLEGVLGDGPLPVSCHHHQSVSTLGHGLVTSARAADGTIEGLSLPTAKGFFAAVQWHPEDTFEDDPAQRALLRAFVEAASGSGGD